MKAKRQALIREIVESQSIQTQEELAEALRAHGMVVTQATGFPRHQGDAPASRCLRRTAMYRYATIDKNDQGVGDRLIRMLCRFGGRYQQRQQPDRHQDPFRQRARRGGGGGQPALAGGAGHDCGR